MIGEITNRVAIERTSTPSKEARAEERKAEDREARAQEEARHAELEQKVKAEITGKGQEVDVTA